MSDIFEGCSAAPDVAAAVSRADSADSAGALGPKGANSAYALRVPFVDAATLSPQRITLADGKTIDLKLPAGVESGTQMRLGGKGEQGPGGAGDAIITIEVVPMPSSPATATMSASTCRSA